MNIASILAPLASRIRMMVARAIVELVDDGNGIQVLQVSLLADEVKDGVERIQNYGFTSVPHSGAEAIALSLGGNRDHVVVIAADDRRYRIQGLESGEVAIYTDENETGSGHKIVLKRGRIIEVDCDEFILNADSMIQLNSSERIELNGKDVRVYASTSYREDIAGYAQQIQFNTGSGNWQNVNWTIGAVFDAAINNAIEPPKVDDL